MQQMRCPSCDKLIVVSQVSTLYVAWACRPDEYNIIRVIMGGLQTENKARVHDAYVGQAGSSHAGMEF